MVELPTEPPCVEDEELQADIRASAIDAQLAKSDLQLQDAMMQKAEAEKTQRQVREECEKLGVEAQEWRAGIDAKERKMEKAHDLVLEKEQIERIKRKAQEAKRQNEEANDSLLGDFSAQLNG